MEERSRRARPSMVQRFRADLRSDPRKRIVLIGLLPLLVVAWIPVLVSGERSTSRKPREAAIAESAVGESGPLAVPGALIAGGADVDVELRARLGELMKRLEQPWTPSWKKRSDEHPFGVDPSIARRGEDLGKGGKGESASRPGELSEVEEERYLAAELAPTSTFLSKTRGDVAVIDGVSYRTGDQIGDFEVMEIGARTVLLKGRFGEYEVGIPLAQQERQQEKGK